MDLNADMGEIEASWLSGCDLDLLSLLHSVNISCGFHAGGSWLIEETLKAARDLNLNVGAHPGYPDRKNFGRKPMPLSPELAAEIVRSQLDAFLELADKHHVPVHHVKAHGAFYNQLAGDYPSSLAFCDAVKWYDRQLKVYGLPGSATARAASELGLVFYREGFADRRYADATHLVPRSEPGSVLNLEEALKQAIDFSHGYVQSAAGEKITLEIDTLCIHGDLPRALELAKKIRGERDQTRSGFSES